MTTVPRYTTNRNLIRTTESNVRTINPRQGSSRFFGGNEAQYKSEIADTTTKVGSALMNYGVKTQDRKDKIIVRNKLNASREELRGYVTQLYDQSGTNSLDTYELTKRKVEEIRQRELKGMDNDSQVEYFASSYDSLSQAHLAHSWNFQESKGRDLDFLSKREENLIYHRDIKRFPKDPNLWDRAVKGTTLNNLDNYKGAKTPEEQEKVSKELKQKEQALFKDFGLTEEVDRVPAGLREQEVQHYSDSQVRGATDKQLSEMDPDKFTTKQKEIMQKKDDESLSWIEKKIIHPIYYEAILPAYKFAKKTVSTVEAKAGELGEAIDRKMQENSLESALNQGRSIPKGMNTASRKAAIEYSNMVSARLHAIADDEENQNSYTDALAYYKEYRNHVLPSQRGKLFNKIALGLKNQRFNNAIMAYRLDERDLDIKIDEIRKSSRSSEMKKRLIEGVQQGDRLNKLVKKEQQDKLRVNENKRMAPNPMIYKIPKQYIGTPLERDLRKDLKQRRDEFESETGIKPPKYSDPILYNDLMSMPDAEKRKLNLNRYGDRLTMSDREKIRNSIGKTDKIPHTAAKNKIAGMQDLNPSLQKRPEEKADSLTRKSNFFTSFNRALEEMPQSEKTPDNIDKLLNRLLTPKKISTGLFGSKTVYNYEIDFLDDPELKEKVRRENIPEDLKLKYGESINYNKANDLYEIKTDDIHMYVDPDTRKTKVFRRKR